MEQNIGLAVGILIILFVLYILMILANFIGGNEMNTKELKLVSLGEHFVLKFQSWKSLNNYFIDEFDTLYSCNWKSWEINKRDGRDLLICSNNSTDKSGNIINSLRTMGGHKVTLRRKDLNFNLLALKNKPVIVTVKETTPRHYKILGFRPVK